MAIVGKPWGYEEWLVPEGAGFMFKMLHVREGESLSLQFHREKNEALYVIDGYGTLELRGTKMYLAPGDVEYIPANAQHRISALHSDLKLLEASNWWDGAEGDIVRLADKYGRVD